MDRRLSEGLPQQEIDQGQRHHHGADGEDQLLARRPRLEPGARRRQLLVEARQLGFEAFAQGLHQPWDSESLMRILAPPSPLSAVTTSMATPWWAANQARKCS